jgi:hypothetical protein
MPVMRSLAPIRIASLTGHIVVIQPEGTLVPDALVEEAQYRGCVVIDTPVSPPTAEPEVPRKVPIPRERSAAIVQATRELMRKNNEADFKHDGTPRVGALREHMGDDTITLRDVAYALATVSL